MALTLGLSSCVGDLDLQPNDPNLVDPNAPDFKENTLAICYSGIACEGISGPGSSYVSGLDGGASAYLRLIFTLSEWCTDECVWIWPNDEGGGAGDIDACTWAANNTYLQGAYYRLLGHIAICNQFLSNTKDDTDDVSMEMKAEARVLRAYSYYNMLDLFGRSSFITEKAEIGEEPAQLTRPELYAWLVEELKDIVDNSNIERTPVLGRVGLDGAEALLAKLYLNGEVWAGDTNAWKLCQERCENIIKRHAGTGFQGTGLAEHYLYLFCRDNNVYMPGGSKANENEILFGIAYNDTYTQSYGGPTFIISGTVTNSHYMPRQLYGCGSEWSCIKGKLQLAQKFQGSLYTDDVRNDLWLQGGTNVYPAGGEGDDAWDAEDYSDEFHGFTGDWKTTGGNAIVKFTGRTPNAAWDGGWDMKQLPDGTWECGFPETKFASTAQPIIRLADIYLMYTECYLQGNVGDQGKALEYWNNIRRRAGIDDLASSDFRLQGLMDERAREFYLESWRRNDLIRAGYFVGPNQQLWQVKGGTDDSNVKTGTRIADRNIVYPIPSAVLGAQPDFVQNEGY